ncbi:MAG: D-alanyl-D-alanine carboxypeptidase [Clostridia bacterium]|nr:D-alanyl-D-alanine carboxypeptidase [Clostridia bacterium]
MKHRLLSIFTVLLVVWLICLPITATEAPASTAAPEAETAPKEPTEANLSNADTVLLYCLETDTVLREKNADGQVYPATAVKLMTALLAYETIEDLTTPITVTAEMLEGVSGGYYGFKAGDTVSPEDLIKLLLLRKSNDAALILAHLSAGGADAFVTAMNKKAEELGMENTFFVNPMGLHDGGMTTTARDLLKLSLEFYSCTQLHNWSGAAYLRCDTLSAGTIYNNNFFLSRYYNGTGVSYLFDAVDGMINGGTSQSGEVLITSATYKGLHYIVILLGGKTVDGLPTCYDITQDLIEKDTQNFRYTKVLLDAEVVCELPVKLGSGADSAAVFPKETLEYYLPRSLDLSKIEKKIDLTVEELEAPVEEGDVVGTVAVYLDGKLLGETELVIRSNITRSGTDYRISQITAYLSSRRFVVIALVVIGLFIIYFIINAIYREQVKKKYRPDRE